MIRIKIRTFESHKTASKVFFYGKKQKIIKSILTSVIHCYIVFTVIRCLSHSITVGLLVNKSVENMKIIINNSSMVPIYVQIIQQIKAQIADCSLKDNEALPSVRVLSKDLNISALTVKKAYDELEADGFVITVHGKGTYVNGNNSEFIKENRLKEVEDEIRTAIEKADNYAIPREQIREMFEMLIEE